MKNVIELAYHRYEKEASSATEPDFRFIHVDDPAKNVTRIMTKEEFITACKTDDEMTRRWIQPVITDLVVYLDGFLQGIEFPNAARDFKEHYPNTFDSIVDLMARCITLSDEDFRQIISFK
jgi:hypothetical protein